ncbi:hypothetical protein [Zestomonas carbonaria]|uniref:Uncharacterized protein n=1 Tax=Zestomonas carbonaria TaxID=2762745 RepID=A0A7U7ERG1_9GAMM|nr:hypothetical protein [Pseudomonas carbonaria]CAD5109817.1 hypothetical protein PSEWESI4_04131 [Pseudomonas carbonaria]
MRASPLLAGTLALLLGSASQNALACGYDGLAVDLVAAHPASLSVSFAIQDAYEARLIRRPLPLPGGFGMRRALGMLDKLRNRLPPAENASGFTLLLVEPGLWARFETDKDAEWQITVHVPRPEADASVVIIGEGVLLALEAGNLDVDRAMDAGVLRIEGSEALREPVVQHWRDAFAAVSGHGRTLL